MATVVASTGSENPARFRRAELAEFLRSRRERLSPEQVGVIYLGRRRTPGLRREEVAQLAGMSTTWYTWLEQGRDINVSDQVLDSLSRTLRLDHDERSHLFTLAGTRDPATTAECDAVTPQMRDVLAKLDPYPACVQGGKYDLLAYNTALRWLFRDLDAIPTDQRNCVWLTFTDPTFRQEQCRLGSNRRTDGRKPPRRHGRSRWRPSMEKPRLPAPGGLSRVRRAVGPPRSRTGRGLQHSDISQRDRRRSPLPGVQHVASSPLRHPSPSVRAIGRRDRATPRQTG